jgi:phosphoribosylformylglycinamidine synthase
MLPIAHGEGRFVAHSSDVLHALKKGGHVALRYASHDNPNGSESRIAGICDSTGRIFGLMPHPERYTTWTTHPFWTRLDPHTRRGDTPGLAMFRAAVEACREPVAAR